MRFLDHGALALLLDLLRARDQESHRASMILALGRNHHGLVLLQLPTPVALLVGALVASLARLRQPAAGARQAGRHECGAREHEANGAAIDADGREGLGEAVDELQVWEEDAFVHFEEQGLAINDVEGGAVGKLHLLERAFLGEDLIDVGVEEGVGLEKGAAEGALDGGLEF